MILSEKKIFNYIFVKIELLIDFIDYFIDILLID